MNHYHSIAAFDAHNIGLLAAIRASTDELDPPENLWTDEERQAWKDGVEEGCAIRHEFEPAARA